MNKGERNQIASRKMGQRMKVLKLEKPWFALKSHGKPCSCNICKRPRYKRKNPLIEIDGEEHILKPNFYPLDEH
jgi:hypothetical protein